MHRLGLTLVILIGLVMCGAVTFAPAEPLALPLARMPEEMPFARWLLMALGPVGLLAMLLDLAAFVGACAVVVLARRPAVIASYLVFLLVPLLLGIICTLKSAVGAFSVLAMADVSIKSSQISGLVAEALVPTLAALMATLPSCCVISVGLFIRTIFAGERQSVGGLQAEPSFVAPERK